MAMMVGAMVYGYSLVGPPLFGTISSVVLIVVLVISLPIDILVMVTLILLLVEVSPATLTWGRHWWSCSPPAGEHDAQE
jgi:hypothetical protein